MKIVNTEWVCDICQKRFSTEIRKVWIEHPKGNVSYTGDKSMSMFVLDFCPDCTDNIIMKIQR